MHLGSGIVASFSLTNHTIAASAAGTAAATQIAASASMVHARAWQVFNLTPHNLEIVFGEERGTAAIGVFVPSTTAAGCAGMSMRAPIGLSQGTRIAVRTVANAAATCSTTTPLFINFWD